MTAHAHTPWAFSQIFLDCVAKDKLKPFSQLRSNRREKVYFIAGENRVKIGVTHNLVQRLKQLQRQCGSGQILKVICVITPMFARRCERKLHAMFAADRLNGEWFTYSDSIKRFLSKITNVEKNL